MRIVLDASAILAVILGEPGGDVAYAAMVDGAVSMVNLCEVYTRLAESGSSMDLIQQEVRRFDLLVLPFGQEQALRAAALRPVTKSFGLSFGDRACIAHALLAALPVLTADRAWTKLDIGVDIQLIR